MNFRIGHGYDVHRLVSGRELWLGGVLIPYTKGLLGHSDADVLIHAICDALLGAAALGDIGVHFPDTDIRFKGIDSKQLLSEVKDLLHAKGWVMHNLDATILAEKPLLSPFIPDIRLTLAEVLDADISDISIKATTTEGLGPEGMEQGISAHAIVLIRQM